MQRRKGVERVLLVHILLQIGGRTYKIRVNAFTYPSDTPLPPPKKHVAVFCHRLHLLCLLPTVYAREDGAGGVIVFVSKESVLCVVAMLHFKLFSCGFVCPYFLLL